MNSVSIIIPCCNYGHFIPDTLDSLLQQTFKDWEAIVIDDGSTDDSKHVVDAYINQDVRFKYFYQSNRGLSSARNRGLKEAKGDFIQFLDADDLIEPKKLEVQTEYLSHHPQVGIVYGDCRFFSATTPLERSYSMWDDNQPWMPKISGQGKEILRHLIHMNIMVVNSPLVRRKVINACGMFDENLKANEDWDLWIRCALNDFRFAYLEIPETNALVRYHAASMSKNLFTMYSVCLELHIKLRKTLKDPELIALNDKEIVEFETKVMEVGLSSSLETLEKKRSIFAVCQLVRYSILSRKLKCLRRGIKLFLIGDRTTQR